MTGDMKVKTVARFLGRIASLFVDTWLVMIACGMIHSTSQAFPAFGYWGCMFGVFVAYSVIGSPLMSIAYRIEDK